MRCPHLDELPPPPSDKNGWPWNEGSAEFLDAAADINKEPPKVSVVTPSFNQASFLEETLRSILLQGYPNVELLVIDGGSTDGSIDVIKRYEPWISHWVSERDRGQSHALNKGFARASGQWIGWQNSDDVYHPNCFAALARASALASSASILYGQLICIDGQGQTVRANSARPFRLEDGIPWFELGNQSLFFRRDIFDDGHFLDEGFHHCMDAEFWWRLIMAGRAFQYVPQMGGSFRIHGEAKTAKQQDVNARDAHDIFRRIFAWNALPSATRAVAIERFRAFLCAQFDAGRAEIFLAGVRDLDEMGGDSLPFAMRVRRRAATAGHRSAKLLASSIRAWHHVTR